MEMIKELFSELMTLVVDVCQLAIPESEMGQGVVIGLLVMPAYRMAKKVPLLRSVAALAERGVERLYGMTIGWALSKLKSGSAKAKDAIDSALK